MQPAYTSNETVAPVYPNHAKEHEQLIKLVQLLMDLLVRRADGAVTSGRQAYMVGVMEHLEKGEEHAERIRNAAIAMSGAQTQAVTDAIEDLNGLIDSLRHQEPTAAGLPQGPRGRLNAVANMRIGNVKDFNDEAARGLVGAPAKPDARKKPPSAPSSESSGPDLKSDQAKREVAKATLTNCAAKKLTLSMPPPKEGSRMTEVFFDPNGNNAVRIPDEPGGTRYHHRQRVSSCEDCQVYLPKIHTAMTEHFAEVKQALSSAPGETMSARETVALEAPLKAENDVAKPMKPFVPNVPGEVKSEKQRTAFAFEALSASVGKIGASDPAEQSRRLRDRSAEVMRTRSELTQYAKDETDLIAKMLITGKALERLAVNTYVETDKVRTERENALKDATAQLGSAESTLKDKRPKPRAKAAQPTRTLIGDVADPAVFIPRHAAWQKLLDVLPAGFEVTVPVSVPPKGNATPMADVNDKVTFSLRKLHAALELAPQVTSAITTIIGDMPWTEGDKSTIALKFAKGST
jgi:hypothetical protein